MPNAKLRGHALPGAPGKMHQEHSIRTGFKPVIPSFFAWLTYFAVRELIRVTLPQKLVYNAGAGPKNRLPQEP